MKQTVFGIVAAFALVASACAGASAANALAASWMVMYYLDPSGAQGATECINFNKTSETNGVIIGTWNSPTFPTWTGEYVQRGQHYSWHGFYTKNGAKVATYDAGDFVNANIAAETSIGALSSGARGVTTVHTGTATLTQVASCNRMAVHRGRDPMTDE